MSNIRIYSVIAIAVIGIILSRQFADVKNEGWNSIGAYEISDDSLLTLTEYRTFQYFWDGAEPVSGMARERYHVDGDYPENDMNVVTSGGTGFGVMAILVGVRRVLSRRKMV